MNVKSTQQPRSTMLSLGYLGLVPFAVGLVLQLNSISVFGVGGLEMFVFYSVVILSFLSGVLWGNAIDHSKHRMSRNALLLSNLFAVLSWGVLLLARNNVGLALILLAVSYGLVLLTELALRNSEQERGPNGYETLRIRLTSGVVVMHGIALIA
ncbi:DUF3429 domain-containing protein [Vibrio sinaloensis]|uniref:DUF3429 domain-containing protein n=1 Tax=Photobacterium sp. (strain ATCC 43367) TaxID=379097 RepID=UPI00057FC5E6|nr:DUF3429 domain-containing protein [Vibrio sinaloensis]KHT45948.1 hypothetical protein RJ46_14590 [Vibrio sinaloensis]